jgi:hypothetical protein
MNKTKCNICGYPDVVTYTEFDAESGKVKVHSHTVDCPGHPGIHPSLWNRAGGNTSGGIRSVSYEDYEKFYAILEKERPHVEKNKEGIEDLGKRKEKKRKKPKPRKNYYQGDRKKRVFQDRKRKSR